MPADAVYVGRPTKWGNPFVVSLAPGASDAERRTAHAASVARYRSWLSTQTALCGAARRELRGRDLVCWCPLDLPCHAEVLLEMVNESRS